MNLVRIIVKETSSLTKRTWNKAQQRYLSSSEVSVALRPFYFAVHPDLFEQHPTERDINENSLKQLNNYIETILHKKPVIQSSKVKFYLRKPKSADRYFQAVNIPLDHKKDIREALQAILSSCSLSTHYVDSLPNKIPPTKKASRDFFREAEYGWSSKPTPESWDDDAFKTMDSKPANNDESLIGWVTRYSKEAEERSRACQPVRDEISRLQEELCRILNLKDLLWICGWGTSHFRGCLHSLQTLATHHPKEMSALKGRTLIFGNESGVSLQGHVIFNSGEVRHNWLELIRNLDRYELNRIPSLEAALSRSLCDIKVTHRLFRPHLLAEVYESHLSMLTTSLGDYRGRHSFPQVWPEDLSSYQLVVEGEAGPLMLSPSGQFITPSSCPISLLVNFISDNLVEAANRLTKFNSDMELEKVTVEQCKHTFKLSALGKDDNVTPAQMAECCHELMKQQDKLHPFLNEGRLWITHYYSLLSDGEICIPWNWK